MTVLTAEARRQIEEARDRRAVAQDRVNRLKAAQTNEELSSEMREAAAGHVPQAEMDLEAATAAVQRLTSDVGRLHLGNGNQGDSHGGFDPNGLMAEQFQDPEFQASMRQMANSSGRVDFQIGRVSSEEISRRIAGGSLQATTTTSSDGLIQAPPAGQIGPWRGIIPAPTPPTSILDLIPAGTTDMPTMPYTQEVLVGASGPGPAAPLSTKPPAGVEYTDKTAASVTIAGWIKTSRQNWSDVAQYAGQVQSRLFRSLRLAVQKEVVSGDGTVSDIAGVDGIVGLLNSSSLDPVDATGKTIIDAVLEGIVALLRVGNSPNVIVLSLEDWETLSTLREGSTDQNLTDNPGAFLGEYLRDPFLPGASQMWGTQFLPSVALTQGTALVLDTTTACTILFREGAAIMVSNSDQDDMLKNRITCLCEARVMMPIWVPNAIVVVENVGS